MPERSILVVDPDPRSLRILEVTLAKAGLRVIPASDGAQALALVEDQKPDLVLTDTQLPELDGFELCQRIRLRPDCAAVPIVFLSAQAGREERMRALELGADDFIARPFYTREIVQRLRMLLHRRERTSVARTEAPQRLAGELADVSVVDLVQMVEGVHRSGVIQITDPDERRGAIYFRQGRVVDAEVGRLSGPDALYRLLSWSDGRFEVEWKTVRRNDVMQLPTSSLLLEGMRRLEDWTRLLDALPPLRTIFEVDYRMLADRLSEIPDEANGVLRLFDGRRSFLQVVDDCEFPDLEAISIIGRLFADGVIYDSAARSSESGAIAVPTPGWFAESSGRLLPADVLDRPAARLRHGTAPAPAQAAPEVAPQPAPEVAPDPQPEPDAVLESQPAPALDPAPEPEPASEPEVVLEPQPAPAPAPEADVDAAPEPPASDLVHGPEEPTPGVSPEPTPAEMAAAAVAAAGVEVAAAAAQVAAGAEMAAAAAIPEGEGSVAAENAAPLPGGSDAPDAGPVAAEAPAEAAPVAAEAPAEAEPAAAKAPAEAEPAAAEAPAEAEPAAAKAPAEPEPAARLVPRRKVGVELPLATPPLGLPLDSPPHADTGSAVPQPRREDSGNVVRLSPAEPPERQMTPIRGSTASRPVITLIPKRKTGGGSPVSPPASLDAPPPADARSASQPAEPAAAAPPLDALLSETAAPPAGPDKKVTDPPQAAAPDHHRRRGPGSVMALAGLTVAGIGVLAFWLVTREPARDPAPAIVPVGELPAPPVVAPPSPVSAPAPLPPSPPAADPAEAPAPVAPAPAASTAPAPAASTAPPPAAPSGQPVASTVPPVTPAPASSAQAKPATSPAANAAAALLELCRQAVRAERSTAANKACSAALRADPENAELLSLTAQAVLLSGKFRQAMKLAREATERDGSLADAWAVIGIVEQQNNNHEAAKSAYRRYLELAPRGKLARDIRSALENL